MVNLHIVTSNKWSGIAALTVGLTCSMWMWMATSPTPTWATLMVCAQYFFITQNIWLRLNIAELRYKINL